MHSAAQPVQTNRVQPATERDTANLRPTEMRYGWCPYGDINLIGPDGTINLHVQPTEIDQGGGTVPNDYHRMLPKGQLIPFPTFNARELMPSADQTDSQGRAVLETGFRTITALDAAVGVLNRYAGWGFTILDSLQGLDQDTAFRIFLVVQPLGYPLGSLVNELSFGARDRIDATEPLTFPDFPDYEVEPLRSELERDIALKLAEEMEAGAQTAFDFATETLDATETSMTTRFAGGQGKTGPDALDRRLSTELGRELPKLIGKDAPTSNTAALEEKVDLLVDHAQSQKLKDENAELKAKLAAMESPQTDGKTADPIAVNTVVRVVGSVREGTVTAKPGGRYRVDFGDAVETLTRDQIEAVEG